MNSNLSTNTVASGLRVKIQEVGRFLSAMVMPNIGAILGWGLITALFIGPGWMPNATLVKIVDPMIRAFLPLLIGYTGGRMIGGQRGAVVGSMATFGVILGACQLLENGSINLNAGPPMFLGAMIVGPLGGYIIKKVDDAFKGKVPAGFEMLVDNFSAGIIGGTLTCLGLVAIGPMVAALSQALGNAVYGLVQAGLIPLASIIIEPAKILFLNNAINQGVFTPFGAQQAAEMGKSIFFMLETNPGPGLGVLLAYTFFAKGMAKESAPGAIIVHFLGGIHEIYFPYVLMNPAMIFAVIAGGMSGVFTFNILGAGLIGPPAPGSILAYIAMTPKGGFLQVMSGVAIATVVSFLVASVIIKRTKDTSEDGLSSAQSAVKDMKATSKGQASSTVKSALIKTNIRKIVVACDAGMGSSAMGATLLKKKIKNAGLDIDVRNTAIDEIPKDTDIVFTHSSLTPRARNTAPNAEHISIENFVDTPKYDELVIRLKN